MNISSYSQIIFEKGYYINDSDEKIDCLIKNLDWKNNPTEIEYKLSESDNELTTKISNIKEFGIDGKSKYLRVTAQIDRSSNNTNTLSNNTSPEFSQEIVLLKVLVEGRANLYQFEEGNLVKYFYQIDSAKIEPLIYKRYRTNDDEIGVNETYKGQLWASIRCDAIEYSRIKSIRYAEKSLANYFSDYNICKNSEQINFTTLQKKDLFNLTLRPGLKMSSAKFQRQTTYWNELEFESKLGLRFGVEAEFVFNFNNNKWAFITEPTFQQYSSKKNQNYFSDPPLNLYSDMEVDYTSIEIPVGLRYYSFISQKSKVFFNAIWIYDLVVGDSKLMLNASAISDKELDINSLSNYAFGLGYNYDSKYGIELRYQTARKLLGDYIYWSSEYKTVSVIFGYTLF